MGDFNPKISKWRNGDKDNKVGCKPDNIKMAASYSQMINKSTHSIGELPLALT